MQQDKIWAFLFLQPVVKREGVLYFGEGKPHPPDTPGDKTSTPLKLASSQKHI